MLETSKDDIFGYSTLRIWSSKKYNIHLWSQKSIDVNSQTMGDVTLKHKKERKKFEKINKLKCLYKFKDLHDYYIILTRKSISFK